MTDTYLNTNHCGTIYLLEDIERIRHGLFRRVPDRSRGEALHVGSEPNYGGREPVMQVFHYKDATIVINRQLNHITIGGRDPAHEREVAKSLGIEAIEMHDHMRETGLLRRVS